MNQRSIGTTGRRLSAAMLACLLAAAAFAEDLFPPELTRFTPYAGNPVFTGAGEGHWDVAIRERGWVMKDGDRYRLWYTGYDGTRPGIKRLGHAVSTDGLSWKRDPLTPIHSGDWVEDMMIVKRGETYYMFAEGRGDQAQLLTSSDGLNWTRVGTLDVRNADGTPIEPGPFGTPTAFFEKGVWHLFFERRDQAIWLATSTDLKVWTKVRDEPVMTPGPAAHESVMIAVNQILPHKGLYFAIYHGRGAEPVWSTNLAVSRDLLHWTKFPGNPLLPAAENKSSGVYLPDGKGFRLYTMHPAVNVHLPRQ